MTNQEAFNRVWQYFIIEEHPKAVTEKGCVYYDEVSGKRCAIGCLFPDDIAIMLKNDYGQIILSLLASNSFVKEYLAGVDRSLLSDLQWAHDNASFNGFRLEIEAVLRRLADKHALTIPITNKATENHD